MIILQYGIRLGLPPLPLLPAATSSALLAAVVAGPWPAADRRAHPPSPPSLSSAQFSATAGSAPAATAVGAGVQTPLLPGPAAATDLQPSSHPFPTTATVTTAAGPGTATAISEPPGPAVAATGATGPVGT